MNNDFPTRFTGTAFLAAVVMLWGGWMAIPKHIGPFFQPGDFAEVRAHLAWWIWMYRVHLFGMVTTVIALAAFGSLLTQSVGRVLVWPGVAVAASGMIVGAVGEAFYYHHGVWGAIQLDGKSDGEIQLFVDSLRVDTEYVTCLIRFGRVFSGLGILLVGVGLLKDLPPQKPIGWTAVSIGTASMALTMLLPDHWSLYLPVFHAKSLWLLAFGFVILRSGRWAGSN